MKGSNKGEKRGVQIEKIAYYVQQLCKKDYDTGNIILIIKSQFYDQDVKEFAEKYHECSNDNNVKYVAHLLYSISPKNMDKYLQSVTS